MYLLLLGIVALAMKYLEISPVAGLSWWLVLSPFALTVVWWVWADKSGYTKRQEIQKMAMRKQKRLDKQNDALGMSSRKSRNKR